MGIRASREFLIKHLQEHLEHQIPRIQSAQVIASALVENRMGKLQGISQRIARTKQSLEAEADKLAAKLDSVDAKAPSAFQNAHSIIDQQHSDIDAMDSELRQLTNLGE